MEQTQLDKIYNFILELEVRDYELDSEKIVNNANYLHYMEHTRHKFCEKVGVTFISLVERGITVVVRKVEIEYYHPLRSGEKFLSCLSLQRKGAKFVFLQDLYKISGEKISSAQVSVVAVINGKISRGDELAEIFSDFIK